MWGQGVFENILIILNVLREDEERGQMRPGTDSNSPREWWHPSTGALWANRPEYEPVIRPYDRFTS